jgi:hypothetical protein
MKIHHRIYRNTTPSWGGPCLHVGCFLWNEMKDGIHCILDVCKKGSHEIAPSYDGILILKPYAPNLL